MKKLLLSALLIGSIANVGAQTIYSQDFSAATGLTVIDGDGDTFQWGLYTGDATTAAWGITGNFAASRSWNPANTTTGAPAAALNPNNFLITPEIVIPANLTLATTLSFKVGSSDTMFFAEQISIYVIPPTANTPALIQAQTPVFNRVLTAANARTALTYTVDITAYAGSTVKIAMRHHNCPDQNLMYFDDLVVTQAPLSTNEFATSKFSVYPNPATDIVRISNEANLAINEVTIADLNGRTVKSVKLNGETAAQINIADLSAGVYMLNISSDQGGAVKKIVKN